jgi:hypothetical protein
VFTISELRELYVAALGHDVSATNLQRVLLRRGALERLDGHRARAEREAAQRRSSASRRSGSRSRTSSRRSGRRALAGCQASG